MASSPPPAPPPLPRHRVLRRVHHLLDVQPRNPAAAGRGRRRRAVCSTSGRPRSPRSPPWAGVAATRAVAPARGGRGRELAARRRGAAVGAPLRYLTDRRRGPGSASAFPWGTFAVNVVGSFVLGLLTGVDLDPAAPAARHGSVRGADHVLDLLVRDAEAVRGRGEGVRGAERGREPGRRTRSRMAGSGDGQAVVTRRSGGDPVAGRDHRLHAVAVDGALDQAVHPVRREVDLVVVLEAEGLQVHQEVVLVRQVEPDLVDRGAVVEDPARPSRSGSAGASSSRSPRTPPACAGAPSGRSGPSRAPASSAASAECAQRAVTLVARIRSYASWSVVYLSLMKPWNSEFVEFMTVRSFRPEMTWSPVVSL